MRMEDSSGGLGAIRIHKNVISSIAAIAAMQIEGVKKVATISKSNIITRIVSKIFPEIKVEINKNDEVKVVIPLIIKYGYNIPEVADKVQESVRSSLEGTTNLSVKDIDISVQGIERG